MANLSRTSMAMLLIAVATCLGGCGAATNGTSSAAPGDAAKAATIYSAKSDPVSDDIRSKIEDFAVGVWTYTHVPDNDHTSYRLVVGADGEATLQFPINQWRDPPVEKKDANQWGPTYQVGIDVKTETFSDTNERWYGFELTAPTSEFEIFKWVEGPFVIHKDGTLTLYRMDDGKLVGQLPFSHHDALPFP